MNERGRLAYLEAMGVDSYFPRLVLPGARPSLRCELPVVVRQVVEPVSAPEQPVTPSSSAVMGRPAGRPADLNLADMLADAPSRVSVKSLAASEKAPRAAVRQVERFELRFVHTASGVLVIDGADNPPSEKALLRLVAQIVFAVTGQRDAHLRCSPFRWPIADNPQLDHSEAAAGEALQSSIRANVERDAVQLVLVLGEVAGRLLKGQKADWQGASLLFHPDSPQLMGSAACKAALWAELQAREFSQS